jgi:hypothetical protein
MRRVAILIAALAALALLPAQRARAADELCVTATPPPPTEPPQRLRFGVTPQLAGTAGQTQGEVVAEDPAARDRALERLRPRRRELVIRLNRLFMSDGDDAIHRFARRARHYARRGFEVESQIRYHPAPEQEGDIAAWQRFVRRATKALAANPALVSLSVTNEVNLPISPNTSDGAYAGALQALVTGVVEAKRTLRRAGRADVGVGFTYAYRYLLDADARFWRSIGDLATPKFRRALDYVGVQLYPGLFVPPTLVGETAGEAALEALTLVRDCYMPQAGLGEGVELWISEVGYATNLGHTEERQQIELADTVNAVHALSGTLGVTDLRYFNLRDNRPDGPDLFDDVGLLHADYSPKPAFNVYRGLIDRLGTRADATISRP